MRRSRHIARTVLSIGSATVATFADARPTVLTSDMLQDMVPGATVRLDTPLGSTIPVAYAADGTMSGEAGAVAFYLGSRADRGRWWIDKDRLCHKWFKWFDAEVQCLRLAREGKQITWRRDDGKTGTATLVPRTEGLGTNPSALGASDEVADAATSVPPAPEVAPKTGTPPASVPASTESKVPAQPPGAQQPAKRPTPSVTPQAPKRLAALPAASASSSSPTAPAAPKAVPQAKSVPSQPRTQVAAAPAAVAAPPAPSERANGVWIAPMGGVVFRVANVAENDVLYVRRGPSPVAGPVGILPPNARGVRLAGVCRLNWCPVMHARAQGWVNKAFLVADDVRAGRILR